jgi:nucleotide-binding universal stress UspA family protein
MEKKILVAVDGSVFSSNSLDYLIRLFKNRQDISIHLLSIVSSGSSDQNWMLDVDPLRTDTPAVELRKAKASRYLKDAQERLLRNGFTKKQIQLSVLASPGSIAAAIHQQANQGIFDALVIGRRGVGKIGELFLGSVSTELTSRCHEIPLWMIDGEVHTVRFLLAVHTTPQSLLAADHLGFFMKNNPDAEVLLYHSSPVFGSGTPAPLEQFNAQWGAEWCRQHLDLDNHLYNAHTRILTEHGLTQKQITTLSSHTNLEASNDLLKQAKQHRCGTVVLGRRGKEIEKGFLGGVSDRTVQQAQDIAIWIVG